jgi:phosphoribosylaminoimidazole-succinocarboxamide synthase
MCPEIVLETRLTPPLFARGKVRDIYDLGETLLFVASDRISAFDCVLPSGIPGKGCVLTQMSLFWFDFLRELVPSHLVTADINAYPPELANDKQKLQGRSMIVAKARMIPVECVARGYLSGSAWKEYRQTQSVCSIPLPSGLSESDRLPVPLFTPAAKAQTGHDVNISFAQVTEMIGDQLAIRLRDLTLTIYTRAADYALSRGIIVADTKFEFGLVNEALVLADEVLTPDSSRYWPAETYKPGTPQFSFDKQYVRDYLETLDWDKRPPAPGLPQDIIERTSEKYQEAYRCITGRSLIPL